MIDSYIEIDLTGVENPCKNYIIGNSGENYSRTLKIKLPQEYLNYSIYLEFRREDGEKYQTPYLDFSEEIIYKIPKVVMVADKIVLSIKAVDDKSTASILLFEKTFCVVATQTTLDDDDNIAGIVEEHDFQIIKLNSDLAEEIENRKKGDNALVESLNNERTARENADKSLDDKIDTEIFERKTADTEVSEKVDSEVEKINGTISELNNSLSMKIAEGDSVLDSKIDTVSSNLVESLANKEKSLIEKIEGVDSDLSSKISADKEELEGEISTVNSSLAKAKDGLEEKILINSADILSTEQELTDKINGVNTDLTTAKEEINASILVETAAREKGDTDTLTSSKAYTDEKIASIDLSPYATTEAVNSELAKKQDKLTAGSNVTLENDTVSVDLSEYEKTADVDVKLATKQDTLTAGDNVKITGNTVSVDLSAYAKTVDLGVYATQTYVQDEIQAAVYDAMEASY